MKRTADDPRARDKERDAAGGKGEKVAREFPVGISRSPSLASLVVTGDPKVLRRMKHGKNATAVPGLRHFAAAEQFNHHWKKKPQKLRCRESQRGEDGAKAASAGERDKGPAGCRDKKDRQHSSRRKGEPRRQTE